MRHAGRMRWLLACVLALGAVTGCSDDSGPAAVLEPGRTVAVDVGDEMIIEVPENASIGDDWRVSAPPDPAIARIVDEAYHADDPDATGSGGVRVYTLQAIGPGTTTVVLHNCYRCDTNDNTPPEDAAQAIDAVFPIVVR